MSSRTLDECLTCYGEGEVHTDAGPYLCPDCKGDGRVARTAEVIEERIRQIENDQEKGKVSPKAETRWLIFELRRARKALLQVRAYGDEPEAPALLEKIQAIVGEAVGTSHPARAKDSLREDG